MQKNRLAHAVSRLPQHADTAAQQSPSRSPMPLDPKLLPHVGGGVRAPRGNW